MREAIRKLWIFGHSAAPAATLLVAVAIAVLSLKPGGDVPSVGLNDKLGHFLAYAALGLAASAATGGRWHLQVAGLAIAYGLALEAGQMALPFGRDPSWLDAAANGAGVLAGIACGRFAAGLMQGSGPDRSRS